MAAIRHRHRSIVATDSHARGMRIRSIVRHSS
jgi:hypothetical protein